MKHEHCSEQTALRVAPTLRDEIERVASNEGRSLANMTRRILERWHAERPSQSGAA
jgi:predicted DNA-binding protein